MLGARFPPYTVRFYTSFVWNVLFTQIPFHFPPVQAKNHAMISKYVVPKIPFPRPDATPSSLGWGKWFSVAALIGIIVGYYRQTIVGRLSK